MEGMGIVPVADFNGGRNNGDMWGGGGLIGILLIAALFGGFGRGGFGGGGEAAVASGSRNLEALDSKINQLAGTVDAGFLATGASINNASQLEFQRMLSQQICDGFRGVDMGFAQTNSNLCNGFAGVQSAICEAKFDNAMIAKDAQLSAIQCCCDTNKNIDSLRYNTALQTCDILQAGTANTQRILDKMCDNEVQALRDKVTELQIGASNAAQNAYLINTLRPYPNPSVPVTPFFPIGGFGGFGFNGGFDGFRNGFGFDGCHNGCHGCC